MESSDKSFRHAEGTQLADPGSPDRPRHFSFEDFFRDMPWLNIPKHRETVFIEPARPKGGLLGGSGQSGGKMSKLQALAAARKKKAEEQKSEKAIKETAQGFNHLTLNSPPSETKESQPVKPLGSVLGKRLATAQPPGSPNPQGESQAPATPAEEVETQAAEPAASPTLEQETPLETTAPSAFAQALLGPTTSSNAPAPRNQFPYPYLSLTSSVTDAFSEPSPDDVVLTAQSKGSLSATKRMKA